jgi:putative tryptophan/tyrosine transport system substrate-binding protein
MRRRDFITLLGGVATAWPLAARAQQAVLPVIGLLGSETTEQSAARVRAFVEGLGEAGFVDGRNVIIEYRWAEGHNERLPALAAELVRRQVAVIVSIAGIPGAQAVKATTSTIPIVFFTGADPVAFGLVASLSRPGGNLTGASSLGDEVGPKKLELMKELLPTSSAMGLVLNPSNPVAETQSRDMQAAARAMGLTLHILHSHSERDLDALFASADELRVEALVVGSEQAFITPGWQLRFAPLASQHKLPTIGGLGFAEAGGLMSYGNNADEGGHTIGIYAGQILQGAKPADLPVQQSTKIQLILNLKTAKALGINLPLTLLARADEVIE